MAGREIIIRVLEQYQINERPEPPKLAPSKTLPNVRFEGLSASRLGYLIILGPIARVGILRVHGRKCIFDNAADNRAAG